MQQPSPDREAPAGSRPSRPPSASADVVLGLCVALGAVALFHQTLNWNPSAATLPRIVAGLLAILGLINALQGVWRLRGGGGEPFLPAPRAVLKIAVAIPAYFLSVVALGFPVATVALTVGLSAAFGFRRPLVAGLAGAVFVAATLLVFSGLFDRPLPAGWVVERLAG